MAETQLHVAVQLAMDDGTPWTPCALVGWWREGQTFHTSSETTHKKGMLRIDDSIVVIHIPSKIKVSGTPVQESHGFYGVHSWDWQMGLIREDVHR